MNPYRQHQRPESDYSSCFVPPPNNPFPVRCPKASITINAIVGKKQQSGWVGIVRSINDSNAEVQWSENETSLARIESLVVLDYGEKHEEERAFFGVLQKDEAVAVSADEVSQNLFQPAVF